MLHCKYYRGYRLLFIVLKYKGGNSLIEDSKAGCLTIISRLQEMRASL
jgi:hypothetical protein